MPLIDRSRPGSGDPAPCTALVAIPTFEAAHTIDATLASVEASIRFHRDTGSTDVVVISVVDDASSDETVTRVRAFAERSECLVRLAVQSSNRGRAAARNRALAAADADAFLFLDHDDRFRPEHIHVCLDTLSSHPHADYVQTRVRLSDPVHADWSRRIDASLTQNLCVRARCHRLIGGFHEEPEVEAYGCDDVLYNRTLHALFHGVRVPRATVDFARRRGNSLDRQYERKFSRPVVDARPTTTAAQRELADDVNALQERRQAEVRARLGEPASPAARAGGWSAPFDQEDEPIFAMMVTGDNPSRGLLTRVAVDSFAAQDHGNRILVVVKSGDHPLDLSTIPEAHRIVIRPSEPLSLGELRNLGLDAIPAGALWTYWDDDDWHHPGQLSAQRKVLDIMGVSACLLTGQVTYSLPDDIAYVNRHPGGFAATLLARKHPTLRFPPWETGSDSAYLRAFKQTWSWFPWRNPPESMVRMFHGANTRGARHFGMSERTPGTWRLSRRAEELLRRVLELYRHHGVDVPPPRPGGAGGKGTSESMGSTRS